MLDDSFWDWVTQANIDVHQSVSAIPNPEPIESQLIEACTNPIHCPALSENVFPGDRVVLAVTAAIPDIGQILDRLVVYLRQSTGPELQIEILATPAVAVHLTESRFGSPSNEPIVLEVHDPEDEAKLAFLAVGSADQALYIHRHLFDADIVIPVHLATVNPADSNPTSDPLFPIFSGLANRDQFATLSPQQCRSDIDVVNNQLGNFFSIAIATGAGSEVQGIFAGHRAESLTQAQSCLQSYWHLSCKAPADCVIATLESSNGQSAWDDVCKALVNSDFIAATHAPLVLWTNLDQPPNKLIRSLLLKSFRTSAIAGSADADELAVIIDQHPIFIHSQLPASLIESLGLGAVASTTELQRLVAKHDRTVLLRDAHRWNFKRKKKPTTSRGRRQ